MGTQVHQEVPAPADSVAPEPQWRSRPRRRHGTTSVAAAAAAAAGAALLCSRPSKERAFAPNAHLPWSPAGQPPAASKWRVGAAQELGAAIAAPRRSLKMGAGGSGAMRPRPLAARRALPEVGLLLGTLDPTPASVSVAFNAVTFLPQWLWLLMVLAPDWDVTRKVMQPLWPVLVFALIHIFIVFTVASNNTDNIGELTTLAQVFNPSVQFNFFSDFSPQASMLQLMRSPGFVSEEWSHVLIWDLFAGRWVYLDGQRRGIFTSHSVLLCNLIGPPGLLAHAATCLLLGKGLPSEQHWSRRRSCDCKGSGEQSDANQH